MKKMNFKKILVLGLVFLPFQVNALENNIEINCDNKNLKKNEKTTCKIELNSEEEVNGIDTIITFDSNLKISNLNKSPEWEGTLSVDDIKNGKEFKLLLYTDENKKGRSTLATFDLTLDKKFKLFSSKIKGSEDSKFSNKEYSLEHLGVKEFKIKNNNFIILCLLLIILGTSLFLFKKKNVKKSNKKRRKNK